MDLAMDGAEAKRRLDLNQVFFVQDVSPKPLMDHLIAQGLLDEETSERVSAKLANEGRTAAARELLDYLKTLVRENARYFHTLLECLKSCHHADLADELQQDLPPVDEGQSIAISSEKSLETVKKILQSTIIYLISVPSVLHQSQNQMFEKFSMYTALCPSTSTPL